MLRARHKLTAYHWRRNRRPGSSIAICSCGWHCAMFRRVRRHQQIRRLFVCLPTGGHRWGGNEEVTTGPAGAPDSEFVSLGHYRQCEKCYRTEDVPGPPF